MLGGFAPVSGGGGMYIHQTIRHLVLPGLVPPPPTAIDPGCLAVDCMIIYGLSPNAVRVVSCGATGSDRAVPCHQI